MNIKVVLITLFMLFCSTFFTTQVSAVGMPQDSGSKEIPGNQNSCKTHEENIKQITENLISTGDSMLYRFDTISLRVQDFYTNKVLTKGLEVSDYELLVEEIESKKADVQDNLEKAQLDSTAFSCSDNPRAHALEFVTDMKYVKASLKEYRTSIKNLIVAVRGVNGKSQMGQ